MSTNSTPRTDATQKQWANEIRIEEEIWDFARQLETELTAATSSPYIDSDKMPTEVIAEIYDALDGITDDAANGHNFGSLVSRVKTAVHMAKELSAVTGERDEARAAADAFREQRKTLREEADAIVAQREAALRELVQAKMELEEMKRKLATAESSLKELGFQEHGAEIATIPREDVEPLLDALKWASNEAKGRLPDWFHATITTFTAKRPAKIQPENSES